MSRVGISLVVLASFFFVCVGYSLASRGRVTSPSPSVIQSGMASWYGIEEQGKLTANGETFNRNALTAAHRHLPFNTKVRVINKENGRSVEVRINDRGPYVKNRVLDLSEAAAKALDMKKVGVTPVDIEVVKPGSASAPPPSPGSTLP